MPTADKLYMKEIEGNIDQIGERIKSLKLGESNVELSKYPTKADAHLLHNAMIEYDWNTTNSFARKRSKAR